MDEHKKDISFSSPCFIFSACVSCGFGFGFFFWGEGMFRDIYLRQMMQRNCFFRKPAISCIQREGSPQFCSIVPSAVAILPLNDRIEKGEMREGCAATNTFLRLTIILRAFYTYSD